MDFGVQDIHSPKDGAQPRTGPLCPTARPALRSWAGPGRMRSPGVIGSDSGTGWGGREQSEVASRHLAGSSCAVLI